MVYLVDTNILLRSAQPTHPMYGDATQALARLRQQAETLYIVPQNLFEFWVVCTRPPGTNGLGLSAAQAQGELTRLKTFFLLLPDTTSLYAEWERLVVLHSVLGKPAHDARLVAAMNIHSITYILTFNGADFARYANIKAVDPATV